MKKNRFIFLLWLLFAAVVWICGGQNAVPAVVLAVLVCIAAEAVIAKQISKKISWDMHCVTSAAKESAVTLKLRVRNDAVFSTSIGEVVLCCKNLLTGETEKRSVGFAVSGKAESEVDAEFTFSHCGKILFKADELRIYDSLGIFAFAKKAAAETATLVLPQLYATRLEISPGQTADIESDEYSMYRSGFDASQTYALREYKEGDPIKNIHWKLSQKSDEIILRELSLPIQNSLLVLIENVELSEQNDFTAAETAAGKFEIAEALGELAVSLSMALCEQKYEHCVAWYEHDKQCAECLEIGTEDELNGAMPQILSAGIQAETMSTAERLASQRGELEYAHIIVITPYAAENRKELPISAECELTWLHAADYLEFREKGIFAEV